VTVVSASPSQVEEAKLQADAVLDAESKAVLFMRGLPFSATKVFLYSVFLFLFTSVCVWVYVAL
jgi:hypothetical protein